MGDENNKWSQPAAPPPPLFTGKKERDLVKQVNDELIERVIGQTVVYYPIDIEHTHYHDLYGEGLRKSFLPPVRVYALVEFDGITTEYNPSVGIDKTSEITVHFHKRRLTEDQDLYVREGDFIQYDGEFYEVAELSQPRYLFGQDGHKLEIKATCRKTREGVFNGE